MPDPAPNAELLRSLGRLVRGLSALFWGLPITLIVCFHTAKAESLKTFGIVPPLVTTGLLAYGLWQLGDFQKQERVWRDCPRPRPAAQPRQLRPQPLSLLVEQGPGQHLLPGHGDAAGPVRLAVSGQPEPGVAAPRRHAARRGAAAGNQAIHRAEPQPAVCDLPARPGFTSGSARFTRCRSGWVWS